MSSVLRSRNTRRSTTQTATSIVARGAAVALFAVVAALGATLPAAAGPRVVDPSTLQPALNPDFAPWTCLEAGQGIVCRGDAAFSYEQEPIGLACPAGDVVISGAGREHMTRWHTADGLATKTVVHLDYPADVFSLAGVEDGPSLTIRGHFNRHYDYLVPGDRDTRVMTEVGAIYLANQPGQGLVLQDTGPVTYEPGLEFESVASAHGIHDTLTDPGLVDTLICDTLG
ncbi:MAG TPA: hypothetical protein VFI44_01960 [Ornithinibacter sp.]|nr:hypothetical protein [Ornithinibacter sp.]